MMYYIFCQMKLKHLVFKRIGIVNAIWYIFCQNNVNTFVFRFIEQILGYIIYFDKTC